MVLVHWHRLDDKRAYQRSGWVQVTLLCRTSKFRPLLFHKYWKVICADSSIL